MRDHSMRHLLPLATIKLTSITVALKCAAGDGGCIAVTTGKGAEYVRLDAVGFMWKEPGTSCIHLENTSDYQTVTVDY